MTDQKLEKIQELWRLNKTNTIRIEDNTYAITAAYISGALACRRNIYAGANPFRYGTQSASDWNDGYSNEETGVHDGFGVDPIGCSNQGITFMKMEI